MAFSLPPRPVLFLALTLLTSTLLIIAHLHPSTNFTIPLLPNAAVPNPVLGTQLIYPDPSQSENRHLTQEQCLDRYPDLYFEADRAREWYSGKGGISLEMVDKAQEQGNARLVILDNQLYVKDYKGGINTRTQAAIAAVWGTVLTSTEPLPDVEFVIQTSDAGSGSNPVFALCRTAAQEALWLMPDFGFFSWPEPGVGSYIEVRKRALEYEEEHLGLSVDKEGNLLNEEGDSWDKKTPKLLWRGVPMVEVRQDLLRASQDQPWSDVRSLDWGKINTEGAEDGDLKSPAEHCQFAYLAHVEGYAYSGRLKYLQQCRSLIITHPLKYIQHYHHLIHSAPDSEQNVVEVPLPLEKNLARVMEEVIRDDRDGEKWVEKVVENGWKGMREGWISPAANECYYRHALRQYASVQTFQPSLLRADGEEAVPYESFLLMGRTHWDPHR